MIEIIPNWHPFFVHFTVAMLFVAVLTMLISLAVKGSEYEENLLKIARFNFIVGALLTIMTVVAGWYAFNSVNHDSPSHLAMLDHRKWAIPTAALFIVLAIWAAYSKTFEQKVSLPFLVLALIALIALGTTGYKGSELVYRHGLGVMSLPKSSGPGHSHTHTDGEAHDHGASTETTSAAHPHVDDGHAHSHDESAAVSHHHENEPVATPEAPTDLKMDDMDMSVMKGEGTP